MARNLALACIAAFAALAFSSVAAQTYGQATDCSPIPGCAQCVPVAYNIKAAAQKFAADRAAKAAARAARQAARAAGQPVPAMPAGVPAAGVAGRYTPGAGTAGQSVPAAGVAGQYGPRAGIAGSMPGAAVEARPSIATPTKVTTVTVTRVTNVPLMPAATGRNLLKADAADSAETAELLDAADVAQWTADQTAVAPSCVTCLEGYTLISKSIRGRPSMGRCECAPGYGVEMTTRSKVLPTGNTRFYKTFACNMCPADEVPLTPAAGLKVTNNGLLLLQQPIIAASGTVPRNRYLPPAAAQKFMLVPGQCVQCPLGSQKSADGVSCEASYP